MGTLQRHTFIMSATGSEAVSTAQQWEMTIKTADEKHAGTDAELFCRVMTDGRTNSTSPMIRCSDDDKKSFKQGKTDNYKFTLPKALDGKVTTLQLWHKNKGNDWQPSAIQLASGGVKYDFYVPGKPNQTKVKCDSPQSFYVTKASLGKYAIEIKTADNLGAGTDAKVEVNLIGSKSSSLCHVLDNKGNDREKGATNVYTIQCHDLGVIEQVHLTVKKTNTLAGAWNIDYVKVTPDDESAHSYLFTVDPKKVTLKPGNSYKLSDPEHLQPEKDAESEDEEAEIVEPVPNVPKGNLCKTKFEGTICTADESGAGTDARVEIWFTDNDGQVVGPLMVTEVNGDTMERGHQNNITVELVEEMNGLSKIQLRQGGEGIGSAWKLEKAEFSQIDLVTDKPKGEKMNFYFNDWLSSRKVYDVPLSAADKPGELKTYTVEVTTTDKMWAGTDDNVKINLTGAMGRSEPRKLSNKYKNNFERGNTDKFELKLASLGELTSCALRKSGHDDWMCSSVKVTCDGQSSVFNFEGEKVGKKGITVNAA